MQHKICNLPQVGTLRIMPGSARILTADKMMAGPVPYIQFDKEDDFRAEDLVRFIAAENGVSAEQASKDLSAFCSSVQQLFGSTELVLPGAGRFFADAEGILHFRQDPLPEDFFPPVPAIRVIHPGSSHTMRVGDNEVDSSRMTEVINDSGRIRRNSWWAAALFIIFLSAGIVYYYFYGTGPSGSFGNSRKISPAAEPLLHRSP